MCYDLFDNDGDLFDCDVTGTTKCANPCKPTLSTLGSSIIEWLTDVKANAFNNNGAVGINISNRLPPLCCVKGVLLEVRYTFGIHLHEDFSNNRDDS